MRVLIVSDIHGNYTELKKLAPDAKEADVMIAAGDLTHFGGREDAETVLDSLDGLGLPYAAVPGNCDGEDAAAAITERGVNIEGAEREIEGLRLYGIGGGLPGPVTTPNEISEEDITTALSKVDGRGLLLVSHQPPAKTVADRAMKVKHVGSTALRDWIETNSPLLTVCGHIHESHGFAEYGGSHVLNPGPFKEGRYAVVDIDPAAGTVTAELKKV
jgi:hypothetical protein